MNIAEVEELLWSYSRILQAPGSRLGRVLR